MTVRFATQTEINGWNQLITTNPDRGDVFQTQEFANIKKTNHWKPLYIVADELYILALERKVPVLGTFWYIPKGPGINSTSKLRLLINELKNFSKKHGVFAIKIEPSLLETPETKKVLTKLSLIKSRDIQVSNTIFVDISKPIDDIMANFSSKTRGNIRAAQKANITTKIVPMSDENCSLFYDMMSASINGRAHIRGLEYFKTFWQTHEAAGTGIFVFAYSNDDIVSMDFIIILGSKAVRKDAASARGHTIRGASALLELEVIKYLKDKNITLYDLCGAPPSSQIKNPDHPYYGFGTFKAGFNSEVTDYIGCYDLPIKPIAYNIWHNHGEGVARRIFMHQYHDLYY
jgi:lipid II:glycine glycyltransferase (peptidoglycan interpeptide bridge formation enzyme)